MADLKISGAVDISTVHATDMLPVARVSDTSAYHATMAEVAAYVSTVVAGVTSWNARVGAVNMTAADVTAALTFTPYNATNPAAYVDAKGAAAAAPVQSVAGHTGTVTLTHTDITDWAATLALYAPVASPTFTGDAKAVTAAPGDADTSIATTGFVAAAITAVNAISDAPSDSKLYGRENAAWTVIPSGSGTVTSVATTGAGISGGPITTSGTLAVQWNAGAVSTVGTGLSLATGTLSATGGAGTVTSITAGGGLTGGTITTAGTIAAQWQGGSVSTIGTGLSLATGTLSATAIARNAARMQLAWDTGAVVANDTVYFVYDAPYNGTINSMTYFTGNGSFTAAVQINGTNVTGLGTVAISSATPATTNATAANTFAAGQRIGVVITAATGSPTDALMSLNVTWS